MASPLSVLIIGGGATGAQLGALLAGSRLAASSALWEKSSSTGRISHSRARGAAAGAVADLGAQFFTAGGSAAGDAALAALEAARVLAPLPAPIEGASARHAGARNLVAPRGAGAVVRFFRDAAAAAGVAVVPDTRLVSLEAAPGGLWRAEAACGRVALARAVVLTLPAPQVRGVGGAALAAALAPLAPALAAVAYSARIALALYFAPRDAAALAAAAPWCGLFVEGSTVRYLSNEARKRGAGGGGGPDAPAGFGAGPPAVVAHSTVAFGALHAETPNVEAAVGADFTAAALAALAARAPPGAAVPVPIETRLHRWKFSQVTARMPGERAALLVPAAAPLVLAGDYLAREGNFSGTAESAAAARELLRETLGE